MAAILYRSAADSQGGSKGFCSSWMAVAERIEPGEEEVGEIGEGVESPPLSLLFLMPFDVFAVVGALFEVLGFLLLGAGEVDRFVLGLVSTRAPSEGEACVSLAAEAAARDGGGMDDDEFDADAAGAVILSRAAACCRCCCFLLCCREAAGIPWTAPTTFLEAARPGGGIALV